MRLLAYMLVAAVPIALGAVDWPSDFWEQVAANHPAPSGSQVAASASSEEVDARVSSSETRAESVPGLEGRATSFWDSNEWEIDPNPKPPGTLLIIQ